MISPDVIANIDHSIFSQIARGSYKLGVNDHKPVKNSLQLVRSANSYIIGNAQSKEQLQKEIASLNYPAYGYLNQDDYEVKISAVLGSGGHQAMIHPLKVYELKENMMMPAPPDKRCGIYLEFFSDEFERIKIRAENVMSSNSSENAVRMYATRNLQLARKLYHDSAVLIYALGIRENLPANSDMYIIYILNLFIIRVLVFYSKFFKPYLNEDPLNEEKLREELHREAPVVLKYPWLFDQKPALYNLLTKFVERSSVNEVVDKYIKSESTGPLQSHESLSTLSDELEGIKGCIKLNSNTNSFVNVFYRMMHEAKEGDLPMIEYESPLLAKALALITRDKYGELLKRDSIHTMLKPANFKKRPHPDDIKRFNFDRKKSPTDTSE